ncbi:uncharacterized protein LOC133184560 [Saccostrea echinata]|uniref:uncharacterized protein LOC133184560 n=1 Tax=Saccostrea echinata TaxID=191078 RepID=UPI002A800B1A|nr:uncharacterized protein LOC133184560 [Saccostrea echinata]
MPRKAKKSAARKASEQRQRMQQRRSQATEQSNISLKCPEESNTSLNCPEESNISLNCPAESNISLNCPAESNISLNCPAESNISINCPAESNISLNCPAESNTSIKCPKQSNISIKCPNQTDNEKSNISIKCPNKTEIEKNAYETIMLTRNRQEKENLNKFASIPSRKIRKVTGNDSQVNSGNEQTRVVVQGSFHQGDARFEENSGKQCVANSLSAIAHSKLKDLDKWDQTYLDNVLIEGNEIYSSIHGTNDLLLISDLPEMIEISGKIMHIRKKDSITATIDSTGTIDFNAFDNCLPLDLAIQESLIDSDGCFICAIDKTFMVMKYRHDIYLFDSHSRNRFDLVDGNGKSLLLQLKNLNHLYQYCCNLIQGVEQSNLWFEVTGARVAVLDSSVENSLNNQNMVEQIVPNAFSPCHVQEHIDESERDRVSDLAIQSLMNSTEVKLSAYEEEIHDHYNDCSREHFSDVEVMLENETCVSFDFIPLTNKTKKKLCSMMKIPSNQCQRQSDITYNMGSPKATKSIGMDGNCLFRAISYAVSNRQQYYQKIRSSVVNHMKNSADALKSFLRPGYESVEEYIRMSGMENDTTWGTELEILAAADLLKTNIFTYLNGSWVKYSPSQICSSAEVNNESIYLNHVTNSNHYECVSSVNSRDTGLNTRNSQPRKRKRKLKRKSSVNVSVTKLSKTDSLDIEIDSEKQSQAEKEREKYKSCKEFRGKKINLLKEKYSKDEKHRETVKKRSANQYENDDEYRERVKKASMEKYANNDEFKEKVKNASKNKYENVADFRERVRIASKRKYEDDIDFRESVKQFSIQKYENDSIFREKVKQSSKQKYEEDETQKNKIKEQVSVRRRLQKEGNQHIENVIEKFRDEVKHGPEYVCACCLRLCFEKQVLSCIKEKYDKLLFDVCISEKYLHKCEENCSVECIYQGNSRKDLWICHTCHRKLLKGDVPGDSFSNNLELEEVPKELGCLNTLEQQLIALNIPFMKILGLPKGGQKGVHGPVVCVPSDLRKVTSTLPRSEDENFLLKVKLKRKLNYKGYEEYQFVNTKHLEEALQFLKGNNTWYSNISINGNWLNPIPEENESTEDSNKDALEKNADNEMECMETEFDSFLDEKLQGVQLDTCLQPADIGQEVLDLCFDKVFEISPAEGNNPVSVLQEDGIEAKTFPAHFPTGKNTYSEDRSEKLTLGRYFNLRLTSVENRFARDSSYIFFSQYLSELNRVISNVQISLRKESAYSDEGKKITGEMLCDKDTLKELFKKDEAIKFLKPVRGTPPYWQAAQKDIFAMIRQLGIPQFFCSFSSADFRWAEIIETILRQQNDTRNLNELSWNDKCKILRSNPVTAARMFDHRFHTFLKDVIMSDAQPIGKVVDYFYRVEFQQRGSPHTHCLFWIDGAPKFEQDSETDVVKFIDRYITCEIPDAIENPEMHDIVMAVQQHSKNHSKSCKKKGTVCRFNFPRPPSERTFISKPKEDIDEKEEKLAKERLSLLWDAVKSNEDERAISLDLLQKAGLTQEEFEKCFSFITKRNTVVLKRLPNELFTNQYNEHLLRAWNANMDIQYVLDAYSCVVYIISYISKAERELGLLLQQTKNEAVEGNLNAQEAMKKVGTAYLHHREISAQEAVYRVIGLRLKECSRKVEFVPVGDNPCRMSIPLKEVKKRQNMSKIKEQIHSSEEQDNPENDSDIWLTNAVDRYIGRPEMDVFQKMCLATFCSEFSIVYESSLPKKINETTTFKLRNNLGYIRKRTKTKPAVIRYPRFSVETAKEKYYQSILQLFLPYKEKTQLKPKQFETCENFYETGYVKYPGEETLLSVKEIVDSNMSNFVKEGHTLEEAERVFEVQGPQDDAWCEICPETEVIRIECIEEGTTATVEEDEISEKSIPDLNRTNKIDATGTNLLITSFPKNEVIPLLRSLNLKQRKVFYKVRDWCMKKKNGQNPEPFHVFVTGGAGTGKSHLIKCIFYEATRLLAHVSENPDDLTVLLTAPTGTAAFNINGLTIHSALGIFKSLSVNHALLSEEKMNKLRSKLENLQILIIDEISMVNKRLLFFVHERLRQLKKMPENCVFGGVSVIAVGDFYQLPPVRTKRSDKLYVNDPSNPVNQLWNDLFTIVELDEIMRQREDSLFAELLNRLRVKKGNETLLQCDKESLQKCIRDGPREALHIFSTNEEINAYNNEMIFEICSEPKLIEAEDYVKMKASGKLVRRETQFTKSDICLRSSLLLAEGARVMLIRNEDVQDGLVNGVMGTIVRIGLQSGSDLPDVVFIHFDNENVGKNAKIQKMINQKRCVGLRPTVEEIPLRNGVRKQFPLQLAWACTIHKVQGLTVKECVVDLNKCFAPGQAYVALSRVTSMAGLYINVTDISILEKKIRSDPDIDVGISAMNRFLSAEDDQVSNKHIKILYHNIQGLQQHKEDLLSNEELKDSDFICLTETWLDSKSNVELEQFKSSHLIRSAAFDKSCSLYEELANMQQGGVSVFCRSGVVYEELKIAENLECIVFKIESIDTVVATIYRPQRYVIGTFMETLNQFLSRLEAHSSRMIVIGDFNQDILREQSSILNFMTLKEFKQCIQNPTTDNGTLIDHVYTKGCPGVQVSLVPTYYSYHEAIAVYIKGNLGNQ